ncbi:MAG TPA: hypothetical protein VNW46_08830 [Gemmatimonadaceae bacterium]|nr:hypothetical protein [Gemmatimonadaceae bacterium]
MVTLTGPGTVAARARVMLGGAVVVAALSWGAAAALLIYSMTGWAPGAIGCGVAAAAAALWRGRHARSTQRVALWIEEHAPALQYALVTAVDPRYAGDDGGARTEAAERALAEARVDTLVRRGVVRAAGPALLALGVALVLTVLVPAGVLRARLGGASLGGSAVAGNRLTPLRARVTPPAYTRWPAREIAEPSTIAALVGSQIVLEGRHDGVGVRVTVGDDSARVVSRDGRWQVAFSMPATPGAMRLGDRQYARLIVLQPVADAPPTVVLTAPVRDTTIREPATGVLTLAAEGMDDIGLAEGYFEYLITSGEEDAGGVQGREGRVGRVAFDNTKTGTMRASLQLDALGLKGGDLLSVRAVVFDGNTVNGPGKGVSETRTIRVATKQEYDSLAVNAAPPQGVDSAYMSQLMIVLATKALIKREHIKRPPLSRDTLVYISTRLGNKEHTLGQKIATILYGGGEGSEGGEVIPDWERALLDTAAQALVDAETDLDIAQPDTALGPELVALRALDKARKAKRLYLRGAPPAIVVNIGRVRMTGTEKPDAGPRTSGTVPDTLRANMASRFAAAVRWLRAPRGSIAWTAGVDSLTMLRVTALPRVGTTGNLPLAEALNDAVVALNAGADATPALVRARRVITGAPTATGTLPSWGGP